MAVDPQNHDDECDSCGTPHGEADHADRTEEQWVADVAATTLRRLSAVGHELHELQHQFDLLADWAIEHGELHKPAMFLHEGVGWLRFTNVMLNAFPEGVRDIAQALPVGGIDYGTADD